LKRISQWFKEHRHAPLEKQQHTLGLKLRATTAARASGSPLDDAAAGRANVVAMVAPPLAARPPWDAMARLLQRYPLPMPAVASPA